MLTKAEIKRYKGAGFIPNKPLKGGGNRAFRRRKPVEGILNNRGNSSVVGSGIGTMKYRKQIVYMRADNGEVSRRTIHHFIPKVTTK